MRFYLLALLVLVTGCASTKQKTNTITPPRLVEQAPLPSYPLVNPLSKTKTEFDLKLLIGTDGTVKEAQFISPVGNAFWEEKAIERILQWKFSPALVDQKPFQTWIEQKVSIQYRDPVYMELAEIVCETREQAAWIQQRLLAGEPFETLTQNPDFPRNAKLYRNLGSVDIRKYPESIQRTLQTLKTDRITEPLLLGTEYVIFKHLPETVSMEK